MDHAAAQLLDGRGRVGQRFAVHAFAVLDVGHPASLAGARDDRGGAVRDGAHLLVRGVDGGDVVSVDLHRVPAEGAQPAPVRREVPAVPGGPALSEPVHVDDEGQIAEVLESGVLGRLPDGALGHLAVPAQHPDAVVQLVQALARERHAHSDRQPLPQ